MITLTGTARVFLYNDPVDMRRSFEGLGKIVEEAFDDELVSGSYFAFINRQKDRIKVLYWDGDGLAIWYKRLEKGSFSRANVAIQPLGRKEFMMLLEGVTPKRINRRYKLP